MRRGKRSGLLMLVGLLCTAPAQAVQIWAAWELALGTHPPPRAFLLTVTSPTGSALPPAMTIPWASCQTIPEAQHCAPIGCPPVGTYDFVVQAQYAEGLSAPSNLARCVQAPAQLCTCTDLPPIVVPPVAARPPRTPPPRPQLPPGLVLSQDIPPLVQVDPAMLHLQPIGDIPESPVIPALPASLGAA